MSNYVQTTFFTPKDALPPGNPSKTIFGAAYDVEFGNIATAITSKFDNSNIGGATTLLGTSIFWTDTGAVNAMVITPSPVITAYTAGQQFTIFVGHTTTSAAVTLNVNGLGAKNVTNHDGSTLAIGQLRIGSVVTVCYDGTQFEITSGQNSIFYGVTTFNNQISVTGSAAVGFLNVSSGLGVSAGNDASINRGGSVANVLAKGPNLTLFDGTTSVVLQATTVGGPTNNQFETWIGATQVMVINKTIAGGAIAITGFGNTAGAQVDMAPDTGTFTGVLTGCTAGVNITCVWAKIGNLVVLWFSGAAGTGTSNATTMTMTGLPAVIQPQRTQQCASSAVDNGANVDAYASVTNSGTITWSKSVPAGAWTNVGAKGMANGVITYLLN